MSIATLPLSFPEDAPRSLEAADSTCGNDGARRTRHGRPAAGVRRRGSQEQGRALESLGHAVEYLVDSGLFLRDERNQRDEHEAIQILMRLSRAVFAECPEVVPLRRRLEAWGERLTGRVFDCLEGRG